MKSGLYLFIFLMILITKTHGFSTSKAGKLADNLRIMMRYPRPEYLPKLRKNLHMYAGILSYLTLKLEQEPDDSDVQDFYLYGPPRFMSMPMKEKRRTDLMKKYNWTLRDLELFLEELNDAKKVWREFARTVKSKAPDISDPEPNQSLVIN